MAEDKKIPRHKKMYKDSPHLERDSESGKMGVKKGGPSAKQKESDAVQSGTDGIGVHEKALQELNQKHSKERLEVFQKHEREYLDVTHKAANAKTLAQDAMDNETSRVKVTEDKSPKAKSDDTGEKKIEKVEKDKKD